MGGCCSSRSPPPKAQSAPEPVNVKVEDPTKEPMPMAPAPLSVVGATPETLDALFSSIDADGSGALDANELLSLVLSMGIELDAEAISSLIREIDLDGDGQVQRVEFAALLSPAAPQSGTEPHLVLNFDVNQTVLMLDSAIGGDATKILNMVLANCTWGRVTTEPEPAWEIVSTEPSPISPSVGLQTFAEFMMSVTDVQGLSDVQEIKATKARRRKALQGFTDDGAPGVRMQAHLASMTDALKLPDDVISATKAEELARLGLDGGYCGLLPSFLHLLRELKRAGRSFSVCFRTFGKDLPKLSAEYNALCEGTHPLFPQGDVVLDGSDGQADMRMDLGAGGCGTFVRDRHGAISLVLGSIEQPPLKHSAAADLGRFYAQSTTPEVTVLPDARAAAAKLDALLGTRGRGRTLALRDFYPGWEATGCQAHGGKPLLLSPSGERLQVFFDDHVTHHDSHIIDVRRASMPEARALPIAATLGIHLIKAEPLHSISKRSYFVDTVAAAEAAWRKQAERRATLASALQARAADMPSLTTAVAAAGGAAGEAAGGSAPKYVPHAATELVRLSSSYLASELAHEDAHEDEENAQEPSPPPHLDLVFIRHAECFHTAAVGIPSAIMAQYTSGDAAVRAAVAPLVSKFDDPVRVAQGEWKRCAAAAPFATLTKADTPLLPSELASGVHVPRLARTLAALGATEAPFLCASRPVLLSPSESF